ncbi:MAG: PEP-CTERM sorting domain-containing protein [Opitutales bacterium]|nr:PEP-CTERM sorting domain-containing protein [Opitutales bacterium]
MKKYIPIISTALLFASASVATAATASYTFSDSTGNEYVNVWDALKEDPTEYGSFTGNNAFKVYCNAININAGNLAVNLDITNFGEGYPLGWCENAAFIGSNFNIRLNNGNSTKMGGFSVKNGATLTVSGEANLNSNGELKMNENSAGTVIVKESSTFYNANTKLGSATATTLQKITIEGSNNTVTFRNFQLVGGVDTSVENVTGGLVEFVADADGLTTVSVIGGNQSFSGSIAVDFTNLLWDESWGEEKTFTLFSLQENMSDFGNWILNSDLQIIKGATDATFDFDAKHLYVTVAKDALSIPEPSTYAAIFGAIAIAFAAYRRRK